MGRPIYNNGYFVTVLALLLIFGISCKKFVTVDAPEEEYDGATVFADDDKAKAAISGLYSQLMAVSSSFGSGGITLFGGLSADELSNSTPNTNTDQFVQNAIAVNNSIVEVNFWQKAYSSVYHANAILEGLQLSDGVSSETKNQVSGEAKFVRAFCYFYLVNLFGKVPLVTTTNYSLNAVLPRSDTGLVYLQIKADLQEAESQLLTSYPTPGPLHPNKWAASALLARMYLYTGYWREAGEEASMVINSGDYSLVSDLNKVFLAYSGEAIWQLGTVASGLNTYDGNLFVPSDSTVLPAYPVTNVLLTAFEAGDERRVAWLDSNLIDGYAYYFPYKYKIKASSSSIENYMVLRLAEQYLIRAEARVRLNDLSGARDDLNKVRERAGLSATGAMTAADLLVAIAHERQVELFAEWGDRWFDLKRTGRATVVLKPEKVGWDSTDVLYPIPVAEIKANKFLTQNAGY